MTWLQLVVITRVKPPCNAGVFIKLYLQPHHGDIDYISLNGMVHLMERHKFVIHNV